MAKPTTRKSGPYTVTTKRQSKSARVRASYAMIPGARQKSSIIEARANRKKGSSPR